MKINRLLPRSLFFLTAVSASCLPTTSPAALILFDTTGEYVNGTGGPTTPGSVTPGFTESGAASFQDSLNWSASNGVGAVSGRLNITQAAVRDTTAAYNTTSFDLSNGGTYTTSVFFLTPSSISASSGGLMGLGFTGDSTKPFLSGTPPQSSYVYAMLTGGTNANQFQLRARYADAGVETTVDPAAGVFSLANSTWYKFTATFTKNVGNSFALSALVEDYGSAGTSFAGTVKSISATLNEVNLSNGSDTTAYGAVRVQTGADKFLALDNFNVAAVPEPSTYALLLGGIGFLIFLRRRTA